MTWLASLPAVAAAIYYFLAIVAAIAFLRRKPAARPPHAEPLSILKPVHGRDPKFWEAIRSHAEQDYPEFEILFGSVDPDDPAFSDIARLQREYPALRIGVHVVKTKAPNAKVGVLAELARHARYPLLLVNDSDIVVEPGYLRAITAPLADPKIGLVTCLYRAEAGSWASHAEALGIATEFAPSVLVARLLGNVEFALGSTMVFRAEVLRSFGGFRVLEDYLADDYHLGSQIHERGNRIELAPVVVATDLGAGSWRETWRHQLRWSRTIRVSRPAGYYGYGVTHAVIWAALAAVLGYWRIAAATMAIRIVAGVVVGFFVLRDRRVLLDFWWIPLRDLFGFAVWVGGGFGQEVHWRDRRLRLWSDGRISEEGTEQALRPTNSVKKRK